jgi:excinuclease ABC subunit B
MKYAVDETYRRRKIQEEFNREHGITPQGIRKAIRDITERVKVVAEERAKYDATPLPRDEISRLIKDLESQMKKASKNLEFEKAALLRDRIIELRKDEELFSPFRKKK